MNGVCLHIDDEALIDGLKYPYRAHIQLHDGDSAVSEAVESVFVELKYDKISLAVDYRLHRMNEEEQSVTVYKPISTAALNIYMMKRYRGDSIEGEPRHN